MNQEQREKQPDLKSGQTTGTDTSQKKCKTAEKPEKSCLASLVTENAN